jgi:DNA transformation protein and related proteins
MVGNKPLTRKQEQARFVAEMMSGFAPVLVKPMFGGFGIYWQGLMFALLLDETLYLKVDDTSQPHFDARGLQPFSYETKDGKRGSLRYHEAPPEVYDEREHMAEWARLGFECAVRNQALKDAKAAKKLAKTTDAKGLEKARKGAAQKLGGTGGHGGRRAASSGNAPANEGMAALANLGPKSQEMLAKAGIKTEAQLRKLGSVRAYARTKAVWPQASLNLLWALEGALSGRDWRVVAETDRADLLMALEDVLAQG